MIIEMIKYKSSLSLVLMFAVMPVLLMSFYICLRALKHM